METPTTEPLQITAGDTIAWLKSLADYSAADGFVLKYVLQPVAGGTPIEITSSASGSAHLVNVAAADSALYLAGEYRWFSFITKDLARYTIGQAALTIAPDPLKFSATTDLRSHAKIFLDAIESALEGTASDRELSFEINVNGNATKIANVPVGDLINARTFYLNEYKREQDAEKIAKGENLGGLILTRFDS